MIRCDRLLYLLPNPTYFRIYGTSTSQRMESKQDYRFGLLLTTYYVSRATLGSLWVYHTTIDATYYHYHYLRLGVERTRFANSKRYICVY